MKKIISILCIVMTCLSCSSDQIYQALSVKVGYQPTNWEWENLTRSQQLEMGKLNLNEVDVKSEEVNTDTIDTVARVKPPTYLHYIKK